MPQYRLSILAELARQMQFTPLELRGVQISAAEELLHTLDPLQAYPADFVIYRLTGYRPREAGEDLLTGYALQHDLGVLIEEVSETLDLRCDALAEPVLQIEDVTQRFNVTSKTIQRWRRKGLPARRFIFPDGKRRVGFLISSVERFFATHQDQVSRGTNFSQVDDAERGQIVSRARRLAVACRCCEREIARRIARKVNRSPATILHTLRKHDADHPHEAVFALAAPAVSGEDRVRIVKGYRRGLSLRSLARRSCSNRSAVYRVLMEERMAKLNRRKSKFIDDPLYHQPDAETAIDAIAGADDLTAHARPEEHRVPRDLPPYLQELYRTPLLSAARERALFLKFNFHKFQFVTARRRVDPDFVRTRELDAMEGHLRKAIETKNQLVRANLRLVVSVARKHLRSGLGLMELISEGNIVLMRAVEGFDIHRGYRFSTYATLALMKGFARSVPQMLSHRATPSGEKLLETVADYRHHGDADRLADREQVRQLLDQLDDREKAVVLAHYGLTNHTPATFDEVSRDLGISKQRVRQIERSAIAKLRLVAGV